MQAIKFILSSEFTSYIKELYVRTCSLVQMLCFGNLDSIHQFT